MTYSVDGIRMPVEDFVHHAGFVLQDPLALLEFWVKNDPRVGRAPEELDELSAIVGPGLRSGGLPDITLLPQNPTNRGTPMTDAEIGKHRSAVEELLQDETCRSFVEGVLSQIGDEQRKAFSGDLLTIFDKVKSLKGWGWRKGADMNFDLGEGGSYVGDTSQTAYINISREARMYGDSSSTGFVGRV
jgi:hypothetical protein